MTEATELRVPAQWTDDCQGKKDYDGELVSISTRYWPRGGGFTLMRHEGGHVTTEENDARPHIRPSATSSILLRHGDPEDWDSVTLIEQDFEGDTQADVQRQVERWADTQYARVVDALRREFAAPPPGSG